MEAQQDILTTYIIASARPGPHVLITAGVHGDEYESILAAFELSQTLPSLLVAGRVTVVPMVNKSACEVGTRTGTDGLDLARTCPGNPAGTVSEKAAASISDLIRQADYYIDLHTGGLQLDIHPLVGFMLHPEPQILAKQRQMAACVNLPLVWGTSSVPNGRTLSVARDAGVPAIYLEYGGGTSIRNNVIKAYQNGCINLLKSLNLIDGSTEKPDEEPVCIDDSTPDGGYLQSKMPAPLSGLFIPDVTLGERVKKGQSWGYVLDPTDGQKTTVVADGDGFVFMLRVRTTVNQGDTLGGIMPLPVSTKHAATDG